MKVHLKKYFIKFVDSIFVMIVSMLIIVIGIVFWMLPKISNSFYLVLKNDIGTLGCLYEQEAIKFDDDYAPLVEQMKVFIGRDLQGQPLEIIRHGSRFDGGYAIATQAFNASDALLGYGIADDISFEEQFSEFYGKPSFGFDCGVTNIAIKNNLCKFVPECIASDTTIYDNQQSTGKVSSYLEHIKMLNLENKKVFLKMDIEGAEYEAFEGILLSDTDKITGIALEIHIWNKELLKKAIKLLEELNKNFILIHVHVIKSPSIPMKKTSNIYGHISNQIELSFINKNLLSEYEMAQSQKHPNALDYPNRVESGEIYWEIKESSL